VDGISFDIEKGETFALLGESGCGKSMTALSLMRLLPASGRIMSGEVRIGSQDLLKLSESEMRGVRGGGMTMIFQEPMTSLNPVITIGEQVCETLRVHLGETGTTARQHVLDLLDAVRIPDPQRRIHEYPHQLSGGMKQRVMIAIALAGQPDLLIADEPTTALDVTIQAQVLDLMQQLQQQWGMAIFLITHDLGVVAEMADRVAVMYAGQIVEQADRETFFSNPSHPYSRKLFESLPTMAKRDRELYVIKGFVPSLQTRFEGCRFAPRCDHAMALCHERSPTWHVDGRRQVLCHLYTRGENVVRSNEAPAASKPVGTVTQTELEPQPVLEVRALQVHFPIEAGLFKRTVGHVRAVDGVDMAIRSGRTLALVGESGCGKTTVGKSILQLIRPTGGSVRFHGAELTRLSYSELRQRRSDFQIIFQDPYSSMNPRMLVGDIIAEGMKVQSAGDAPDKRRERVERKLQQVGLSADCFARYPHEFSGGQRQRISIARALAVEPKLIICDEPTSALDVSVQAQILNLLQELQREFGISYLFITHNMSVVSYIADEIAVMYLGRIVECGTVRDVLRSPQHPYTQALLSAVPTLDPETKREVIRLEGDIPSPSNPPTGCYFHPRCPKSMDICRQRYPRRSSVNEQHYVDCHLYTNDEPNPSGVNS
jgi:peptide/nickel transport system ATP-binding protein